MMLAIERKTHQKLCCCGDVRLAYLKLYVKQAARAYAVADTFPERPRARTIFIMTASACRKKLATSRGVLSMI
jgi:hypothetical protein